MVKERIEFSFSLPIGTDFDWAQKAAIRIRERLLKKVIERMRGEVHVFVDGECIEVIDVADLRIERWGKEDQPRSQHAQQ